MSNNMKIFTAAFFFLMMLVSCTAKEKNANATETTSLKLDSNEIPILSEKYVSNWNDSLNVDSPAFWTDGTQNWILATMKEVHGLIIYNAEDGKVLKTLGNLGSKLGQFNRPNGIWVIENYCFVVERDNHRVQVLELPSLKSIGIFGANKLIQPYGLSVVKAGENYTVFVTDDYKNENATTEAEEIPADSLLGKRVLEYSVMINQNGLAGKFKRYIGATSGNGLIKVAESVYADVENNTLLIAEEYEAETSVKVYNLKTGEFTGTILGKGLFHYQAEGIAMYDKGNGKGYWFCTDQDSGDNTFYIFDRQNFKYMGAFKSKTTQNTDGVWLTQQAFPNFPKGAFIPVHDDGGIGIFDLKMILDTLNL